MVAAAAQQLMALLRSRDTVGGIDEEEGRYRRQQQWHPAGRMQAEGVEDYHGHNAAALKMKIDSMINVDRPAWGAAAGKRTAGRGAGRR